MEITLQPAYKKFHYVYIPARFTGLFQAGRPQTKKPVEIVTGSASFAAELQYNSSNRV